MPSAHLSKGMGERESLSCIFVLAAYARCAPLLPLHITEGIADPWVSARRVKGVRRQSVRGAGVGAHARCMARALAARVDASP